MYLRSPCYISLFQPRGLHNGGAMVDVVGVRVEKRTSSCGLCADIVPWMSRSSTKNQRRSENAEKLHDFIAFPDLLFRISLERTVRIEAIRAAVARLQIRTPHRVIGIFICYHH
jgi:hypothetical protein